MKVKYFAALAAASVFGLTGLTACGSDTTEADDPAMDATTEVAPDAADPGADMGSDPTTDAEVDPAAEPCAAE